MVASRWRFSLLSIACAVASERAGAQIVDFTDDGTVTTPVFTEGGVTVTGTRDIVVTRGAGLSILGGESDATIDSLEIMSFSFQHAVTDVAVCLTPVSLSGGTPAPLVGFTAYAPDGASDGSTTNTVFVELTVTDCMDVTELLDIDNLARLEITVINDGVVISGLSAGRWGITSGAFSSILCLPLPGPDPCAPSEMPGGVLIADDDVDERDGVAETQLGMTGEPLGVVAAGSVGFDGVAYTPSISAYSYPVPSSALVNNANIGFQRYTLVGPPGTPVDLTIDGSLSYSQSELGAGAWVQQAALFAFRMDGDVFDPGGCSLGTDAYLFIGCLTLNGEVSGSTLITMEGLLDFQSTAPLPVGPSAEVFDAAADMSLTISGMGGDRVFIGAYLNMLVTPPDAFADSRTALTFEFADPSLAVPDFAEDTFATAPPAGQNIDIDVRPLVANNRVWPDFGPLPVALLGSTQFDALQVDTASLKLGPGGGNAIPWAVRGADVNHDGFADLVAFFRIAETGIRCGDTDVLLTGATHANAPFHGRDVINVAGCRGH